MKSNLFIIIVLLGALILVSCSMGPKINQWCIYHKSSQDSLVAWNTLFLSNTTADKTDTSQLANTRQTKEELPAVIAQGSIPDTIYFVLTFDREMSTGCTKHMAEFRPYNWTLWMPILACRKFTSGWMTKSQWVGYTLVYNNSMDGIADLKFFGFYDESGKSIEPMWCKFFIGTRK